MRFVPEEQSFADRKPRDSATDAPPDYEAPPFFTTAALQHSNVKLTWDATPDKRRRALSKKVKAEELRDDDFKACFQFHDSGVTQQVLLCSLACMHACMGPLYHQSCLMC